MSAHPIFSKDSVCLCCSTPVVGVFLPCLCNPSKTVVCSCAWISNSSCLQPGLCTLTCICLRLVSSWAAFTETVWDPALSCCPSDMSPLLVPSILFRLWYSYLGIPTLKPSPPVRQVYFQRHACPAWSKISCIRSVVLFLSRMSWGHRGTRPPFCTSHTCRCWPTE